MATRKVDPLAELWAIDSIDAKHAAAEHYDLQSLLHAAGCFDGTGRRCDEGEAHSEAVALLITARYAELCGEERNR